MISYIVIGICILLLLAVIFISAKPISMGIEARRDINTSSKPEKDDEEEFENIVSSLFMSVFSICLTTSAFVHILFSIILLV